MSVLLAGAIARDWDPTELGGARWLWWIVALLGIVALVSFALAVWPRVEHGAGKVTCFGHVAKFEKLDDLRKALDERAAKSSKGDRDLDQLFMVAGLVDKKYSWIGSGMALLGVGLLLCGLAVIVAYFS